MLKNFVCAFFAPILKKLLTMDPRYLLFPVAGAIVGSLSGLISAKIMLNYALGTKWPQLSRQLTDFIAGKLVSRDEIISRINKPENYLKLMPVIEHHIDDFLRERLKIAIPM